MLLLVPASDEAPLRDLLARLLGDLCPVVTRAGSSVPVSARIGAAWRDEPVQDHSDLLHRADLALYAAKRFARGAARIHRKAEPILPPRNRRLRRTSN